jgi:poly(3-hydroxybutyrate) depolymerase
MQNSAPLTASYNRSRKKESVVPIPTRFVSVLPLMCAFVCVLGAVQGPTQEKPPAAASRAFVLQKGQIVPSVRSEAKPDQSYALYVPTNYAPERRWPIIYVFDPDASGSRPLELMKEAAESYGYLLAGSNNSRNGSWEIERDAAQEMWSSTHNFLSIDDQRVYFAGFSGGARVSVHLAQLCNCAHGVFLNSAGFGAASPPSHKPAFAIFTMAGMADFNYAELAELDTRLESLGARHFFQRFDGKHAWAPATVWQEALAWSALWEMKDNLRDQDKNIITTEFARATDRLRQREATGDSYFAVGEYRSVGATFDGLTDTSELKKRLSVLADSPAVRNGAKQEKAEIEKQRSLEADIFKVTAAMRDDGGDQASLFEDASNRIRDLRERSIKERNPDSRRALERAAANVFVISMETAQQLLDQGHSHTAELYFELGAVARPDSKWPPLSLAECHAAMGDRKAALRDLKRARETGSTITELDEFVKTNAKLAPLMDTPEYRKLVGVTSQ